MKLLYLSIRLVFFALAVLSMAVPAKAQLSISNSATPEELVRSILLGQGVIASNIKYTGAPVAIGSFNNGNSTNIGINSGIILSTGDISLSKGPNMFSGHGRDNGTSGDDELNLINTTVTFDAAVLEFDFIPSTDTLRVRYVFASEEYNEFVCSEYNDVFGFFISGPGISGVQNIAFIPNTSTPVAINSVNNGNPVNLMCEPTNPAYFIDNIGGNSIEYDGFTTVLEAVSPVKACQSYHIRLAIADVSDHIYDSGVFLEAQSFKSAEEMVINASSGSAINEHCDSTSLTITRTKDIQNEFTIFCEAKGTAVNGVDYETIPSSITFAPGQASVELPIIPLGDGLNENTEVISLSFKSAECNANNYTINITIEDLKKLEASIGDDISICPGESAILDINAFKGSGSYSYHWSTGGNSASEEVSPDKTTEYSIEVQDLCTGEKLVKHITVFVRFSNVSVIPDTAICGGNAVQLYAFGGNSYEWYPAEGLSDPFSNSPLASPAQTTVYHVTIISGSCVRTDTVRVAVNDLKASFEVINEKCDDQVKFINRSSYADQYSWDFGDGSGGSEPNPVHRYKTNGEYTIRLIASSPYSSCIDTIEQTILVESNIGQMLRIPNSFTPNNDGVNDVFSVLYENQECKPLEFLIYNRWGELVYTNFGQDELNWDGTFNGKPVSEGSYVYIIRGETYTKDGYISLIR